MMQYAIDEIGSPLQIFELIRALLEAQIPQLLVVAGLVFLGVGIVGKLPGTDPGERGRKFGVVFGSVLLVVGLGMYGGALGGGADGGAPTTTNVPPTDTATSTRTETTAPTPTLESVTYPRGFDESGFTDSESALSGHLRVLKRESFAATYTSRGDGAAFDVDIEADPETRRVHKVWRKNGSVESELYYESGSVEVRTPGDQGFDSDVPSYVAAAYLEGQLDWFGYSNLSDPQVHRHQGRTAVSYFVTSTREDRDHEGELTILENGLVVQYNLRIETDGRESFVQFRLTDLGETTVEEPDWVDSSG
jgi:hypothetical protein